MSNTRPHPPDFQAWGQGRNTVLKYVAKMCYNGYMERKEKEKPTGINTRYPQDILNEMRRLAEAHGRSFNGEVIWALRYYLAAQKGEQPHGKKSL